jgi:hypothetical protein
MKDNGYVKEYWKLYKVMYIYFVAKIGFGLNEIKEYVHRDAIIENGEINGHLTLVQVVGPVV